MINLFFSILFFCMLSAEVYEGYMLYTPGGGGGSNTTYYKDWEENTVNAWSHSNGPASMPYLLPGEEVGVENSLLYYPCRSSNPTMDSGGVGGKVVIYDWAGEILYTYNVSSTYYQHHHDIAVLPNGNFIVIAWERLYSSSWETLGRSSVNNNLNQMWTTVFIEVEPTLDGRTESYDDSDDSEVVWEWRISDHLVQNISSSYSSTYGQIGNHPELMNVNEGNVGTNGGPGGQANGDWMHINALDYNADLDQLVFSSRFMSEIFIIDHSTTTEEAATHSGGNSGKGGDFLYRWGNPSNYDRGNNADEILADQHSVNWIPDGYPGAGNLILFNNYHSGSNSAAVLEFETPLQDDGSYELVGDNPYGPDSWTWIYNNNIASQMQGGAFRLPNGNTFITDADDATIIEVTSEGVRVYEYEYPSNQAMIARASKYAPEFFDSSYTLGDINNDGDINVLDVISLVNIILGSEDSNPAADMNEDGVITVLDIILLINVILV